MDKWIIFALLSMLFAGGTSVLAKIGLKEVDSEAGLLMRTLVVMIFVSVNFILFSNQSIRHFGGLSQKHVIFLLLSGVTTGLSWIFYYKALQIGNVSHVAIIDRGSLVVAIVLSYFFLGEPLTPKVIIGGSLIMAGLLVMILWKS
jgi:transporter family protein